MAMMRAEARRVETLTRRGDWDTSIQWVRLEEGGVVHLFAAARPENEVGDFAQQADSMYENLRVVLEEHRATPADVITERLFCSDVDSQVPPLQQIRRRFYAPSPPATFLGQPPCLPGRLCELQAHVMLNADDTPVGTRRLVIPGDGCAGGIGVSVHGYEHLHLTHLTGEVGPGGTPDFTAEAESMFARAEECLRHQGLSFRNVVRTWFYLRDMDQDYAAFNRVRNRFYAARPIAPLPASTGIQGSVFPSARRCGMDLYALGGCAPYALTVMHSPTMNEPSDYRSAFSRGLRLDLTDASFLHVSGTASIDAAGEVAHVGDIEGQVERMLDNVQELLAGQDAGLAHAVSAITYLKSAALLEPFRKVCARHPELQEVVNSVVVAGVCRPEWLCEMELQAVAG